jgi:hypothetical protein
MSSRVLSVDDWDVDHFQLSINAGESIWNGVHQALDKAAIRFAQLEFAPGMLDLAVYHTAPPETTGKTLVKYGTGINIGKALLFSANAIYGLGKNETPLLHCHGFLIDAGNRMHGGHLSVMDCMAGGAGLTIQVTSTPNTGFAVELDRTSNMHVFHPVKYERPSHGV